MGGAWVYVVFAVFGIATTVWAQRRRRARLELLRAAGAVVLRCSGRLTQSLSILWLRDSRVYVLDGVVAVDSVRTSIFRVFREGLTSEPLPDWPRSGVEPTARDATCEGEVLKVRFTGFTSGTLTLKGLSQAEQLRVVRALRLKA